MEFIRKYNLVIANNNKGIPTFSNAHKGWLDLTLSNYSFIKYIKDWRVEKYDSFSDHKYIRFDISNQHLVEHAYIYNIDDIREVEWTLFADKHESDLKGLVMNKDN